MSDPATVTVVGTGFNSGEMPLIDECPFPFAPPFPQCKFIQYTTADASGNFTTPVTVTRVWTPTAGGTPVDCLVTQCGVTAVALAGNASAPISFATGKRAAALKKCAKVKSKKKKKKCKKRALKLPV